MNSIESYCTESGVRWLGEVPGGWGAIKLKYLTSCNDESLPDSTEPDKEIHYVDISSVTYPFGITKIDQMSFSDAPSRARRLVKNGDTIVSTVRTYLKAIAPIEDLEQRLVVSTGFAVIRPRDLLPGYLSRLLLSHYFLERIASVSVGVSYPAVNPSDIGNIVAPKPPIAEQIKIASFLDRETARIDALIQKKERMIELLKEKRIALITQAVTKGLDPNAKMKDSGIDWLGEVPEEWNITRLKYAVDYKVSSVDKKTNENEFPVRLFNYTDVYNNNYLSNDMNLMAVSATEREISEFGVFESDILITKDSEDWRDIAKPAMIISSNPDILCGYHLAILKPDISEFRAQYLFRVLQAKSINTQFQLASSGVTRYGLPKSAIGEALIPIPPVYEQDNICLALEHEDKRMEQLNQRIVDSITLLHEYRSSLIHSAVTGKIDLRDYHDKL